MIIYNVYIDAAIAENRKNRGSYGVVIRNGAKATELKGAFEPTTVNRMFLMGCVCALNAVSAIHEFDGELITVHMHTRSEYLVNTMNYKLTKRRNLDLWEKLDRAQTGIKVYWHLEDSSVFPGDPTEAIESAKAALKLSPRKDPGYGELNRPGNRGTASSLLGREIKVSDIAETAVPLGLSVEAYCKKFLVNKKCARDIIAFYRTNRKSVEDYISLKAYGQDWWSTGINVLTISQYLFVREIRKHVENEQDVLACARWHKRGLTLTDSIYKVLIDARVRDKVSGNDYGNKN